MNQQQESKPQPGPNLVAGLTAVVKNVFGLALNRIELAALEFSEVRANLLKVLLISACGILALWFAIAYWTLLLVYLAWESIGWTILAIIAAAFSLIAFGIFLYARSVLAQGKLSMPATMAELRNDRAALLGSDE